jgi:hypothetical protein
MMTGAGTGKVGAGLMSVLGWVGSYMVWVMVAADSGSTHCCGSFLVFKCRITTRESSLESDELTVCSTLYSIILAL